MLDVHTTLSTLITVQSTTVSFRHLSSLLRIPSRAAQHHLLSHLHSHPSLSAIWCVTEPSTHGLRTRLTEAPPANTPKTIWALGPQPDSAWLADDCHRERQLVAQPSHEVNALRDGCWNAIKSLSNMYDGSLDPRVRDDPKMAAIVAAPRPSSVRSAGPKSTALLAAVKERKKKGKKGKKTPNAFGAFTSAPSRPGSSLFASKSFKAQNQTGSTPPAKENKENCANNAARPRLMKSGAKPLGSRPSSVRKPTVAGGSKKATKKLRRVIQEEDSDQEQEPALEEDERDAEEDERRRMAEEDALREREELERAEQEKKEMQEEVDNLSARPHMDAEEEEQPESPQLKEVEHDEYGNSALSRTPDSQKRKYWASIEQNANPKRVRREQVEEDVMENGYIVSKKVTKYFDGTGKEVNESEAKNMGALVQSPPVKSQPQKSTGFAKLWTPMKKNAKKEIGCLGTGSKKKKRKDDKKRSPKAASSLKKSRKKTKGQITSYFM